jgi:hypothetical protein
MNSKRSWVLLLGAAVPLCRLCAHAASWHTQTNPIGEKVYAAHSVTLLLPIGILVGAVIVLWLLARIQRKAGKRSADPSVAEKR